MVCTRRKRICSSSPVTMTNNVWIWSKRASWATNWSDLADYIGRKRTLIYSILAYSLVTGCTALAWSWPSFVVLRFVVGLALGAEWGTGASIVAEMWPAEHRGKGAGLMQCGLGIGFFCASGIWFFISAVGPPAWRWMYMRSEEHT